MPIFPIHTLKLDILISKRHSRIQPFERLFRNNRSAGDFDDMNDEQMRYPEVRDEVIQEDLAKDNYDDEDQELNKNDADANMQDLKMVSLNDEYGDDNERSVYEEPSQKSKPKKAEMSQASTQTITPQTTKL